MSEFITSAEDTIAAIATPPGIGGLAVIRLSGPDSTDIVRSCTNLEDEIPPYLAKYSFFKDPKTSEMLDEVIILFFKGPKSFTAEDVVEISCHGGHYVARKILQVILHNGARLSEPGEFTKRAFLNGRIDLTQAEAVGDVIASQTAGSHKMALRQLQGHLKDKVSKMRQMLIDTVSILELELDFSEEEIDQTPYKEIFERLNSVNNECHELIRSYTQGKMLKQGILAPIIGRPNAGKSSILNALLKEDRALVSDIAGTTRDTVEESISHNGIEIRLVDTAGLHQSDDTIESMGISKTKEIMQQADILLHVIDAQSLSGAELPKNGTPVITIYNKIDLLDHKKLEEVRLSPDAIYTSATEMQGISAIGDKILSLTMNDSPLEETAEGVSITNERHLSALKSAAKSLEQAMTGLQNEVSPEFVVVDLRGGLQSLGLLTGETTTDDILDNIFNNFCIGK